MKKIFCDTNILLDVFLEREPFCRPAQILWSLAERRSVVAAVSAVSIANIHYIMKRLTSSEKANRAVRAVVETFKIVDLSRDVFDKAFKIHGSDFEDSIQYVSALKFRADAIISRDLSGFPSAKIPVMDAVEYLALLERK